MLSLSEGKPTLPAPAFNQGSPSHKLRQRVLGRGDHIAGPDPSSVALRESNAPIETPSGGGHRKERKEKIQDA